MRGVIAAAATPITDDYQPDLPRFVALCRRLLDNGCDGLNICGTTGEATSFTVAQRMAIMDAAAAVLPLDRLMVGTGAASIGDAVTLTKHAAERGFAAALVLPPFYYKNVADDGIVDLFARLVAATADRPIPIHLYNFPALSGVEVLAGARSAPARKIRQPDRRAQRLVGQSRLRDEDRRTSRPSFASFQATKRCCSKPAPANSQAASRQAST